MLSCEDKDMAENKERIAAFNELYLIHLVVNWMMLGEGVWIYLVFDFCGRIYL